MQGDRLAALVPRFTPPLTGCTGARSARARAGTLTAQAATGGSPLKLIRQLGLKGDTGRSPSNTIGGAITERQDAYLLAYLLPGKNLIEAPIPAANDPAASLIGDR